MLSMTRRTAIVLSVPTAVAASAIMITNSNAFKAATPVKAATSFLASLDQAQVKVAQYDFDADERFNFHFVPKDRNGLAFRAMNAAQQAAALELMSSCLSQLGMDRVRSIRDTELVLRSMEKAPAEYRNPDKYYITVFGTPSKDKRWAWRFEGHHVTLNWTMEGDKVVGSTPQFFGSNPARIPEGQNMAGFRLLPKEEDNARALVKSLSTEQAAKAIIADKAPSDILTGANREAMRQGEAGIPFDALTSEQQKALKELVGIHAAAQSDKISRARLASINKDGWKTVVFAWMGGMEPGQGHYYRIQGKSFLVEYDCTQNNNNHIHAAWRDFGSDFGGKVTNADVLGDHLASGHGISEQQSR
jgi:hypothetical protein